MARLHVGKLDPVVQEVVGHPEDSTVAPSATRFSVSILRVRICLIDVSYFQFATSDPVVFVRSHNFTSKSEFGSSTQACKFL
jgi:hypothetical protein